MLRRRSTSKKPQPKIFRKFLDFLETDMWTMPVNNFMEQNSIVFDREQGDPEVYEHVHKRFHELVDTLITSYCEDTKITTQELIDALKSTDDNSKLSYKDRVLLEPVVASQDFNVFVPMMMRKNVELQLQALKMLEHLSGLVPSSLKLDEEDAEIWKVLFDEDESERFILISVLKQSKEEWDRDQRLREEWQKQLENAKEASKHELDSLEAVKRLEQERYDAAMHQSGDAFKNMRIGNVEETHAPTSSKSTVAATIEPKPTSGQKNDKAVDGIASNSRPLSSKPKKDTEETSMKGEKRPPTSKARNTDGAASRPKSVNKKSEASVDLPAVRHQEKRELEGHEDADAASKFDYRTLLKDKDQIPEELIKQRAAYLRQQRDKLLEMKRKEREKQLKENFSKSELERPRTAKAARGALMNNMDELDARRAIASKLKTDVVKHDD
ncbi:ADP-ribosylation factor-like 2-binding protein [Aphelenchoides avenae]|nr:ADP-ribosylation factor-like 2-binding protein [Aphelenchus avenae]